MLGFVAYKSGKHQQGKGRLAKKWMEQEASEEMVGDNSLSARQ